jgi:hypothetical protein
VTDRLSDSITDDASDIAAVAAGSSLDRHFTGGTPRRASAGVSPIPLFAVSTLIAFALMAAWSVGMPRFSGPDEPTQIIHAAAVVRGQFVGLPMGGPGDAYTQVNVPAELANGDVVIPCYQWNPTVPASCVHVAPVPNRTVSAGTYAGRYPPLYYAIVGLPTLVVTSPAGITLMRLVSSLLNAIFLGLAIMCVGVWSRNRLLALGILLALTPMAFYLGGMVNPNGLEISAAICLWVSGLVLALEHLEDPPRGLVAVMVTAAAVLTLTRGVSPLWTFLTVVILVALGDRSAVVSLVRRRRDVQVGAGIVLLCGVAAVGWIVRQHALDLVPAGAKPHAGTSTMHILFEAFGQTGSWFEQMVGIFGSLEAPSPLPTFLAWWVAIGAVVLLAFAVGRRREIGSLVVLIVLVLLLPAFMELPKATSEGLVWQGRYTLPLGVGIPLIGTAIIGRSALPQQLVRRTFGILAIALPIAGLLAFCEALRRFSTGVLGPLIPWRGGWQPPGGTLLDLIWYAVATTLFSILLWSIFSTAPSRDRRALEVSHSRHDA